MGVNSLPKTVIRQRRDCDLNPGPSAPEYSTLTTRLPSHPSSIAPTLIRQCVCVVGIGLLGNALSLRVFAGAARMRRLSSSLYLSAISLSDCLVLGDRSNRVDNTCDGRLPRAPVLRPARLAQELNRNARSVERYHEAVSRTRRPTRHTALRRCSSPIHNLQRLFVVFCSWPVSRVCDRFADWLTRCHVTFIAVE